MYDQRDIGNTLPTFGYRWAVTLEQSGSADVDACVPLVAETLALINRFAGIEADRGAVGIEQLLRSLDANGAVAAGHVADRVDAARSTVLACDQLLRDGGRLLAERGATPLGSGVIDQINASGGGVPKVALDRGVIDPTGLIGDTQRNRQHHGRPWQAVCLFSAEVIAAWAAQGHPISNGSVGENLTLSGLAWEQIRPGVEMHIGDEVVLHITAYAVPCGHQAQWFSDGDFGRLSHETNPGFARLYAEVLRGGAVAPGDRVVLA